MNTQAKIKFDLTLFQEQYEINKSEIPAALLNRPQTKNQNKTLKQERYVDHVDLSQVRKIKIKGANYVASFVLFLNMSWRKI